MKFRDNVDGLWAYHAKWLKSEEEMQVLFGFTHMWNLQN